MTGDEMKDTTQRARQMPVDAAQRDSTPTATRENTLKRINVALTRTLEIDEVNRGTDPYNSSSGIGRGAVWNRERSRR
ncbi:MAG: hypothetical protein NAOJABEB_01324 [Steroidobacteraceae bacterium]|nr:hypothetical protein [Steroidobacteraceae bacterium]